MKAKDEAVKRLKRMTQGTAATEDMVESLEASSQVKEKEIIKLKAAVDKLEMEKKALEGNVASRDDLGSSKDRVSL